MYFFIQKIIKEKNKKLKNKMKENKNEVNENKTSENKKISINNIPDNISEKYEYLKNNIYNKGRRKILVYQISAEFNMVCNFLLKRNFLRTFCIREMHGLLMISKHSSIFNQDLLVSSSEDDNSSPYFFVIFPKKSGDFLEMSDFMNSNTMSRGLFTKNYIYKLKHIYQEKWEGYIKIIERFIKQENNNIISNFKNYVDSVVSFYKNTLDNSLVLIDEIYSDLPDKDVNRFTEISNFLFEKLKIFIQKNLDTNLCSESILINRSFKQTYNYIIGCKMFNNKRFLVKQTNINDDLIELLLEIKDQIFPDSSYLSKCRIYKLSDISCLMSITHMTKVEYFNLHERFHSLKEGTIYALQVLKKSIENESIDDVNING